MPWSVTARGDEWCVVKDSDGHVEGCHASRAQALKQQAALYAQEAKTASANGGVAQRFEMAAAPFRMEVTSGVEEALVASVQAMTQRLLQTEKTLGKVVEVLETLASNSQSERESFREALTAAVNAPREVPVVNVSVPSQEAPVVNVATPEPVIRVDVPTPVVNVTLPATRKTITFERDPLDGRVSSANVEEVDEQ